MTWYERGYDTDPDELKRIAILEGLWLARDRNDGVSVSLSSLFPDLFELDSDALTDEVERLEERRLVAISLKVFGGAINWSVSLTDNGEGVIRDLIQRRDDAALRRRGCSEAMLYWLNRQVHAGIKWPPIVEFMQSSFGHFFGRPFSREDVQFAGEWLERRGLIETRGSAEVHMLAAGITRDGEDLVERDETLTDWQARMDRSTDRSATTYNISNVDNLNLRDRSPGGSQRINVEQSATHAELTTAVANALVGMVAILGLDAQQRSEAESVVGDLRVVASEESPASSRLRDVLNRAATVAVAGTSKELGNGVVELVHHALRALGLS